MKEIVALKVMNKTIYLMTHSKALINYFLEDPFVFETMPGYCASLVDPQNIHLINEPFIEYEDSKMVR